MPHLATWAAAAPLTIAVVVSLAACTSTPEAADQTPSQTPSSATSQSPTAEPQVDPPATETSSARVQKTQDEYTAAIAAFPFAMPEGYSFPEIVPAEGRMPQFDNGTGSVVAYTVWRCSVAQAARDAHVLRGDDATAESLIAQLVAVGDVELPGNTAWLEMVAPAGAVSWGALEGETGICYFWLRPFGRWNV